jgi:hypothetical protein
MTIENYELIAFIRHPFKPNIMYHVSFHEPEDVQWRFILCFIHYIQAFDEMMSHGSEFIESMNCDKIQIMLFNTLHNFFTRRKIFFFKLFFSFNTVI